MKFSVGREDVSDQETGLTLADFRHVVWKEVGGWTGPAIFDGEQANRFVFDPEDEGQDILSAAEMRDELLPVRAEDAEGTSYFTAVVIRVDPVESSSEMHEVVIARHSEVLRQN